VIEFLSADWLAALERAAHANESLRSAMAKRRLVLQQTITDTPAGDCTYHVVLSADAVAFRVGPVENPTVTFSTDYETAVAVNQGARSALAAFIDGRLRIGGDVRALVDQSEVLGALDDVFASVRSTTTFPAHA
jgi:hypothetical protein